MTTVVAAIIERDGQVLVGQRKASGHHALKWEFPGGKVEMNETPQAALARELEEELAVEARIEDEIARYEFQYQGRSRILLIFYRVREISGEPKNLDFAQLKWVARDELKNLDFLEGDTEFLRAYSRG